MKYQSTILIYTTIILGYLFLEVSCNACASNNVVLDAYGETFSDVAQFTSQNSDSQLALSVKEGTISGVGMWIRLYRFDQRYSSSARNITFSNDFAESVGQFTGTTKMFIFQADSTSCTRYRQLAYFSGDASGIVTGSLVLYPYYQNYLYILLTTDGPSPSSYKFGATDVSSHASNAYYDNEETLSLEYDVGSVAPMRNDTWTSSSRPPTHPFPSKQAEISEIGKLFEVSRHLTEGDSMALRFYTYNEFEARAFFWVCPAGGSYIDTCTLIDDSEGFDIRFGDIVIRSYQKYFVFVQPKTPTPWATASSYSIGYMFKDTSTSYAYIAECASSSLVISADDLVIVPGYDLFRYSGVSSYDEEITMVSCGSFDSAETPAVVFRYYGYSSTPNVYNFTLSSQYSYATKNYAQGLNGDDLVVLAYNSEASSCSSSSTMRCYDYNTENATSLLFEVSPNNYNYWFFVVLPKNYGAASKLDLVYASVFFERSGTYADNPTGYAPSGNDSPTSSAPTGSPFPWWAIMLCVLAPLIIVFFVLFIVFFGSSGSVGAVWCQAHVLAPLGVKKVPGGKRVAGKFRGKSISGPEGGIQSERGEEMEEKESQNSSDELSEADTASDAKPAEEIPPMPVVVRDDIQDEEAMAYGPGGPGGAVPGITPAAMPWGPPPPTAPTAPTDTMGYGDYPPQAPPMYSYPEHYSYGEGAVPGSNPNA